MTLAAFQAIAEDKDSLPSSSGNERSGNSGAHACWPSTVLLAPHQH